VGRDQHNRRGRGAGNHYESNPKTTDFGKWDLGRSGRDPVPTIRREACFLSSRATPRKSALFPPFTRNRQRAENPQPRGKLDFLPYLPYKIVKIYYVYKKIYIKKMKTHTFGGESGKF
jgi:hypothetical protein